MERSHEHFNLPLGLQVKKASFYGGGELSNIRVGISRNYEYVVFDYDPHSETANRQSVAALKMKSPSAPTTNLSSASGIQLERVGEWILAFEPGREIESDKIMPFIEDVLNLLEYAKDFPGNV